MAKAIIHIGMDKTGTTYIQELCAQIRPKLSEIAIHYPTGKGLVSSHHVEFAAAHGFSWRYDATNEGSLAAWSAMSDALPEKDKTLFLSSEHFCYNATDVTIGRLKRWLDVHGYTEVKIVVFLRNQISWLISAYGESIKWGSKAHLDRFFEANKTRLIYSNLLGAWAAVFGEQNVTAINYDFARNKDPQFGILNELWSALGISRPKWATLTPAKQVRDNSLSCQVLLESMRLSPINISQRDGYGFATSVLGKLKVNFLKEIYRANIWPLPSEISLFRAELEADNVITADKFGFERFENLGTEIEAYQKRVIELSETQIMHSAMLLMLEGVTRAEAATLNAPPRVLK